MSWGAEWTQRALKDVARLDRPMQERIVAAVERFAETGMGDVRRLRGSSWLIGVRKNRRGHTYARYASRR